MDIHSPPGLLYLACHMLAHWEIYHTRGKNLFTYKKMKYHGFVLSLESHCHFYFKIAA